MYRGLATALVGTIAVLAMLGTALGASLGETDLFNPTTSAADAKNTEAQTQVDTERARLEIEQAKARGAAELDHYKAVSAAEEAALQRQHELELQQQQQAFERKMAWMEVQQSVLLGAGAGVITVLTIAAAYYLYTCGQAKLMQAMQNGAGRQVPAGLVPGKPTTGTGWQATPSYQGQSGGNGRGPRVYSRSQR